MKKLTLAELVELPLGSIVKVVWTKGDEYRGVIFGNMIGYEDGKIDRLNIIGNYMLCDMCEAYLEDKEK